MVVGRCLYERLGCPTGTGANRGYPVGGGLGLGVDDVNQELAALLDGLVHPEDLVASDAVVLGVVLGPVDIQV